MPVKKSQITKDQFRGDILQRDYSTRYNPETQMYEFDYVELTPETEEALKGITYYRFSSNDIAEVKEAISDYIAKIMPPAPRVPGPEGEISKEVKDITEGLGKAENILTSLEEKQRNQGLTNAEEDLGRSTVKAQEKLLYSKKIQTLKAQQDALSEQLNTGEVGREETDEELTERLKKELVTKMMGNLKINSENAARQDQRIIDALAAFQLTDEQKKLRRLIFEPGSDEENEYNRLTRLIDAFEILDNPDSTTNEKENAQRSLTLAGERVNIPKPLSNINKNVMTKAQYNNAKALLTQLNTKKNLTASEKLNIEKAKTTIQDYEGQNNINTREKREEQKNIIRKATTSKYQTLLNRARNAGNTEVVNAYQTMMSPVSTKNQKDTAQAKLNAALKAEVNMPNIKGFFGNPNEGLQGGKRKTKTKKAKKVTKKKKTRKH